MENYHEKRQSLKRRQEDLHKDILITACARALRMNQIDHIKDVLRFALEKTEFSDVIEKGGKI